MGSESPSCATGRFLERVNARLAVAALTSPSFVHTAGFTALSSMRPSLSEGLATASMAAGWALNALVAEWLLRKQRHARLRQRHGAPLAKDEARAGGGSTLKLAFLIVVAMLVVACGPPTNTPNAGRGTPYLGTWDLSANATLSLLTPDGGTELRACTYEWTFELAPTEQQLAERVHVPVLGVCRAMPEPGRTGPPTPPRWKVASLNAVCSPVQTVKGAAHPLG